MTARLARPRLPGLLRERAFRRYWSAQTISMSGDQISSVAVPYTGILALHASAAQMGYLAAAIWLPSLLFAVHAGAWADRRGNRRRLMIIADLGRAALLATVPVCAALHMLTLGQLYGVAFGVGTLGVLFTVCDPALFVALVPESGYLRGQSLVYGSRAFSFVGGPSLGGLLVQALTAPFAVAADAASYLGSAYFLGRIAPAEAPPGPAGRGTFTAGARYIAGNRLVRAALIAAAVVNFFDFVFTALFALYATRSLHIRPGVLGLVLGAGAFGAVLGSVAARHVSRRAGVGWGYVIGVVLFPGPLMLVPLAGGPHELVLAALFGSEFLSGVGVMILDISIGSIFAAVIPDQLRSRVTGAFQAVNYGTRPLGSLVGGALGTAIGVRPTLWIAAAGGTTAFLWLLPSPLPHFRMPGSSPQADAIGQTGHSGPVSDTSPCSALGQKLLLRPQQVIRRVVIVPGRIHGPGAAGADMNERSPGERGDLFAADWASALAGLADAALAAGEVAELLAALAADTLAVAWDIPFQPEQAAKIGAALVEAGLVDPMVLGRSLTVIRRQLALDAAGADLAAVSAVQEAVAAGYIRALRDQTRAETQRSADELRRGAEARFQAELRHQAQHDPLTGVANRTLFLDRLAAAIARPAGTPGPAGAAASTGPARRIGICYLDLDGFTSVNDTFGHDVGDELLIAVAGRLRQRIEPAPGLVARIGGDQFIALVEPSGGPDAMVALASDVLTLIERPFRIGRHRIGLTASVGIVERPVAGTELAGLVKDADSALYRAKAEGPGRWAVYDAAQQATDSARMALTTSMRSALEAGEFTVVYQPIVALPGGELRGVEALLRWDHPKLGVLAPAAFIELAESSGVITPLGRWVMETACAQAAEWHRARPGAAPFISVNLSAQQATDPGFVGDVARIMAATGLPFRLLQLELTEGALVGADSRPLETLQELAAMGVRIAADDFGSGYSNLAYLKRLPVGSLKLSASFIKELWPDGPADEPVIAALAGLAHQLGLDVTAEGVETPEHARQLSVLGCDSAQGWYYAAAVPGRDITAVLRDPAPPNFPRPALPHG